MSAALNKFWQRKPWKSYAFPWFVMKKARFLEVFRVWGAVQSLPHAPLAQGHHLWRLWKFWKFQNFWIENLITDILKMCQNFAKTKIWGYNRKSYTNWLKTENCRCHYEKSDCWKICVWISIIYFLNLFFMFILS